MTYNFGRDVVNNNSVNNYVFSGRIPSDFVSTLVRFVVNQDATNAHAVPFRKP